MKNRTDLLSGIAFLFCMALLFSGKTSEARALVEGSTYFYHQTFAVTPGSTCSADLERLSALLFGPKGEHRHLVAYSAVICGTDKEQPLLAEVLFEPATEEDRGELEEWMQVLEGSVWQGQSLSPFYVDSIFWDVYGQALKKDGTYAGTFEKPRLASTFGEIVVAKDEIKAGLNSAKVSGFLDVLKNQIGDRELSRWQKEVLPATQKMAVQFGIYFLTGDGTVEKSSLAFQLERDCAKLSCY